VSSKAPFACTGTQFLQNLCEAHVPVPIFTNINSTNQKSPSKAVVPIYFVSYGVLGSRSRVYALRLRVYALRLRVYTLRLRVYALRLRVYALRPRVYALRPRV